MLQIRNITKVYKTANLTQVALDRVSLNFRDNEFVAILGPSGSGKTTLLNIIGGLDRYDHGDLIINNVSTKKYKDRDWDSYRNHTIGFVFQSYNLIPHQSILSNVELALTISGVSAKERKRRALEALDEVGLKEQAHKKPNQLSGGQMQRVAIARALINNPDILLADEPTGALDTKTSVQVMDLLKKVAKDRLVIMVTHNPELANDYANRIVKLQDGHIISDTNPFEVNNETNKITNKKFGKAKMNFFTALGLSFNNLLTKKGRTVLTAFAGSIGIIGIALILSLSQGFQNYIDKIQEDTMSSYPLTIQSETANIFSALLSTAMDVKESNVTGENVKEVMLVSSMMNSIGTNDLKSFKKWLEENKDKYENDVNKIEYSYSVSPRIYTIDATDTITQLNPSTIMSSIYSDGLATAMSSISTSASMGAFSQTDFNELENNFTLLKGKWPKNYDEVLLVLPEENQISDLLVYMLGFRDSKELKTLIQEAMAQEVSTIDNTPLELTYDDLMSVDLRLVNVPDLYKYNEKYKTYEDMTNDDDYMQDIYDSAEKLKVTGLAVSQNEGSTGGIMYSKALTDHVIELAYKSDIVKKQIANKDIDVFSGNSFDEEEDKNKSKLDFDEMVSIDEDTLKEAFKVNVSEDDFKNAIDPNSIVNIVTDVTTDYATNVYASDIQKAVKLSTTLTGFVASYYDATSFSNPPYNIVSLDGVDTYVNNINKAMIEGLFLDPTASALLSEYSSLVATFTDDDYQRLVEAVKIMTTSYYETLKNPSYGYDSGTNTVPAIIESLTSYKYGQGENTITPLQILGTIATNPQAMSKLSAIYNKMISSTAVQDVGASSGTAAAKSAAKVGEAIGSLFGEDMMTIDTDKFAEAFKFDMDEDELSRLMSSMLTSSTASYSNNLIGLGYQDANEPTSVSIFFNNFDSKQNFLDLLDNYNETVNDEDKEITYTDITGLLMGSVKTIIDSVTYVLIAFVSISLVVSSIMIAVITLISVMERTKEIGILRAMGASKHNVSSIFNAETFIIGLLSGLIGIGFTYAAIPVINNIIHNVTGNYDINAVLETNAAIILVLISIVLTIFAGIIPSRKASKQDPVIALRTE